MVTWTDYAVVTFQPTKAGLQANWRKKMYLLLVITNVFMFTKTSTSLNYSDLRYPTNAAVSFYIQEYIYCINHLNHQQSWHLKYFEDPYCFYKYVISIWQSPILEVQSGPMGNMLAISRYLQSRTDLGHVTILKCSENQWMINRNKLTKGTATNFVTSNRWAYNLFILPTLTQHHPSHPQTSWSSNRQAFHWGIQTCLSWIIYSWDLCIEICINLRRKYVFQLSLLS